MPDCSQRRRPRGRRAVSVSAAVFLFVVSPSVFADDNVVIIRDTWGIPHIFADTDSGAMFGAGYAAAEDRMYQMHRTRRAVQGRLAELIGDLRGGPFGSVVGQDRYFRHLQLYKYGERVVEKLDPDTRVLLRAYSDGVNRYVSKHKDDLLYLFDGETPEPWTPADSLGVWNRIGDFFNSTAASMNKSKRQHDFEDLVREFGLEKAIEMFLPKPIIDEDAAVVKESDVPQETIDAICEYSQRMGYGGCPPSPLIRRLGYGTLPSKKFSHAWVVGGKKSTTGKAVLHSDPQTSIAAPAIWHEFHIKGATFDARGVGIAGCPTFLIGFSGHFAWGLTALGADMSDLFELKMVGRNRYEYDGREYDMSVSQEVIKVKGGNDVPITIRDSILGPVVTAIAKDVQRGEEFISRAIPNFQTDTHTVTGVIGMIRAKSLKGFTAGLAGWLHPSANCVFGDDQGNIGYWMVAGIPLRSTKSPVGGLIAQDGSSSEFDWLDIIPAKIRPHVINPAEGSIWSANHLPVGSWYPLPTLLGTGGRGDTQRSWRLAQLLKGKRQITPQDMLAVHLDNVNASRREVVRAGYHTRDALRKQLSRSAFSVLNILESWFADGAHSDTGEPLYAAAHHIRLQFRRAQAPELVEIYGGGDNGLSFFLKTLKKRLDEDPQAEMSDGEIAFIDQALAAGWDTAIRNYGSDPNQWKARFAAGPGTYRVPYFNTLEGFGSQDPRQDTSWPGISTPDGGTILSQRGQSYSQWVDLSAVDTSKAVLPLGMAENPAAKHFSDQAQDWLNVSLRAAPLARDIIEKMAESRTMHTYRPRADLDCDGSVDLRDVEPFIVALIDPEGYINARPNCDIKVGDINGDGSVDLQDVEPFIACVLNGGCR